MTPISRDGLSTKAELTPDDYVVEIGPGLGALTEFALDSGARVLAIEKDRRLADFLRTRFPTDRLEILHADALDYDLRPLFAQPRVKLLGNLPYYVSSQLLLKFTKYPSPISLWLFMLQKELARRLSAAPGTSDYGALTLIVQLHYRVDYLRTVPASVFLPQPDVDSAFVQHLAARARRIAESRRRKLFFGSSGAVFRNGASSCGTCSATRFQTGTRPRPLSALNREHGPRSLASSSGSHCRISRAPRTRRGRSSGATERFPVVDEQDRLLGDAPRAEVHGNNLLHRAVHILVFNNPRRAFPAETLTAGRTAIPASGTPAPRAMLTREKSTTRRQIESFRKNSE